MLTRYFVFYSFYGIDFFMTSVVSSVDPDTCVVWDTHWTYVTHASEGGVENLLSSGL